MRRKNPRYSVVVTTPGYPILDVVKATYTTLDEAKEAVTLGPAHEQRPWRRHGSEYEWTGAPNIWAKPARKNPIVEDGKVFRIFKDGQDTGKYATTREKAEEIMARMEERADKPARERKSRPEDIFALRPFAQRVRPPEPERAARPRVRQYVEREPVAEPTGPGPFARDAGQAWTFVKEPAATLASWSLRSTTRTPNARVVIEPLAPREAGYSVLYVRENGPDETDVAYLIKRPPAGGIVNTYALRHVWMLPELDDHAPRRVPVEILRAAIDGALQQHPLASPQAYIR